MSVESQLAQKKYREAELWDVLFDTSILRYRAWVLLWVARRDIRRKLSLAGVTNGRLRYVEKQIDEAHDYALVMLDNAVQAANCVSSSQLAGRIYEEEFDGREHYRIHTRGDQTGGDPEVG